MSLRTPHDINSMWFDEDRSKLNEQDTIKFLMGKWFMRTVPEVESRFCDESSQIDYLAEADDLDPIWFTPEGRFCRL